MKSPEFEIFSNAMDKLLKVSHDELKAKLDAEKRAKAKKKGRKVKVGRQEERRNG